MQDIKFESKSFITKLKSMLKVDFRRMFTMPLLYIVLGACFSIPVLILVMTTAMSGSTTTNPSTGEVTTIEGFTNVWQAIGSVSSDAGAGAAMSMDLVSMCNINMLFFIITVLVCLFISEDFRSGYAKNLFTVRASKKEYVISKTLVGFVGGTLMLITYFLGALLGGAISKLSFEVPTSGVSGIVMSMIAKMFLMLVFVSMNVCGSVFAKQRTWLSMVLSFAMSMLLFTMIPMITPLDSTIINVILCLVGGLLFSIGLGVASNQILKKISIL